jgi:hypothetical protein
VAGVSDVVIRTDSEPNPNPIAPLNSGLEDFVHGRDVLFGTHGFHVDRANGIANLGHWAEWLQLGPNGAFVGVLWPGDSRWVPYIDYPVEGDEAIKSGQLLAEYLLANLTGAASWSFASHSLGARVVLQAIRGLAGSAKLKSMILMAAAIDDTCLSGEYMDAAGQMQKISVVASRCDDVLKLAFPAGNLLSGLITRGHPYWNGALGRYGPNPANEPDRLFPAPILPDSWEFGHGSYINCDDAVDGSVQESEPFQPLPLVLPSENNALLPNGAYTTAGKEKLHWRPAWAAGFVSSRV